MATLATSNEHNEIRPEPDSPCRIATFYEDVPTRERLIRLCDLLIKANHTDIDFEISWWKYRFLSDAVIASLAAQAAAQADLILFSTYASSEPPAQIRAVNEIWLTQRGKREGLLMVLIDAFNAPAETASPSLLYFQELAQRANLEFVSHWFTVEPGFIGESMEHIRNRATQVTPVLEEILQRSYRPMQWGINE